MTEPIYIGLMSGTSADGIDLSMVRFINGKPQVVANYFEPYSEEIREQVVSLYSPGDNEIDRAFSLDIALAHAYSSSISKFLDQENLKPSDIEAIGFHGQTIRHRPTQKFPFTLQIGCAQTLATLSNTRVVADFRTKDMALGGQGAPLVPAFHNAVFSEPEQDVVVVNIGGIANLTFLPAKTGNNTQGITGFDTGPGNALLDDWHAKYHQERFDESGRWGASGTTNQSLLDALLKYEYFSRSAPKSAGREVFNLDWLNHYFSLENIRPQDVQATLVDLTAISICDAINESSSSGVVYLCGGGTHNINLKNQIDKLTPNHKLLLTKDKKIDDDSVEAVAFAWLAYAFDKKIFGNIPAVTGASKEVVLGTAFEP